jgi:hypothetical protein
VEAKKGFDDAGGLIQDGQAKAAAKKGITVAQMMSTNNTTELQLARNAANRASFLSPGGRIKVPSKPKSVGDHMWDVARRELASQFPTESPNGSRVYPSAKERNKALADAYKAVPSRERDIRWGNAARQCVQDQKTHSLLYYDKELDPSKKQPPRKEKRKRGQGEDPERKRARKSAARKSAAQKRRTQKQQARK